MADSQHIIFPALLQLFPENTTDLERETPFQLLIAVMMSAQTTDIQVNKVTNTLFQKIQTPPDVIAMGQSTYNTAISSIGLHNSKSKHVYQTSHILIDLHQQGAQRVAPFFHDSSPLEKEIPKRQRNSTKTQSTTSAPCAPCTPSAPTIKELISLPGVGIKTAKVVLHVLWDAPHIAVDTHVHRVSNRLGFVDTQTPEQTDRILESVILPEYRHAAHHTLIFFGRYHCTARNPKCGSCPLYNICPRPDKKKSHG